MFSKLCGNSVAKTALRGNKAGSSIVAEPVRFLSNYHPVGMVSGMSCGSFAVNLSCGL